MADLDDGRRELRPRDGVIEQLLFAEAQVVGRLVLVLALEKAVVLATVRPAVEGSITASRARVGPEV
jgi:hypothetical protein